MELTLLRSYHEDGTNGKLFDGGALICSTIELPWKENQRMVSCIPEGRYSLIERHTAKRGRHLMVKNVADRSGILFHPANDALKELKGCIAPVSELTGDGRGIQSRKANDRLNALVFEALDKGEEVFITIQKVQSV